MLTIREASLPGQPGYTFDEFERRFLAICQEHHDHRRALAFAFVMYDVGSPEVAKLLRDTDYWNALDALAGNLLTVFTVQVAPNAPESEMRGMVRLSAAAVGDWEGLLEVHFGITSPQLPAVLFFQTDEGGVLDSYLVRVAGDTVETAFQNIRQVLRAATESVEQVRPENRDNTAEIFNLIKGRLRSDRTTARVLHGLKTIPTIRHFIDFLRQFV